MTTINIGTGIFDYVEGDDRYVLENAWAAINETESWDYIKKNPEHGYAFCNDFQLNIIMKKMCELNPEISGNHSGASFACVMRTMQFIAQNGIDKFKELLLHGQIV